MNAQVVYNIFHDKPFGWIISIYFFLAAVAAGTFAVAALIHRGSFKEYRPFARLGAIVSPILMVVNALLLIFELGRPERFWRVAISVNPTSAIMWGAKIIPLFTLVALWYGWKFYKDREDDARGWTLPGIILAVLVPLYTSFELVLTKGKPLWNSSLLIVLFVIGAGIAGITTVILLGSVLDISAARKPAAAAPVAAASQAGSDVVGTFGRVAGYMIIANLALALIQLLLLLGGSNEARVIARSLISGSLAAIFWVGFVVAGSLIPAILFFNKSTGRNKSLSALAAALALLGIFALRAVEIFGGQNFTLN